MGPRLRDKDSVVRLSSRESTGEWKTCSFDAEAGGGAEADARIRALITMAYAVCMDEIPLKVGSAIIDRLAFR